MFDVRLSNTATHADHWLAPWPGSEPAILLAIASYLIQDEPLRPRVRAALLELAGVPGGGAARRAARRFEAFEKALEKLYAEYSFAFAERESGVAAAVIQRGREAGRRGRARGSAPTTGAAPPPATSAAGRSRAALFLLNALMGAVGVPGGVFPNAWNKFVPKPIHTPPHPHAVERAHAGRRSTRWR